MARVYVLMPFFAAFPGTLAGSRIENAVARTPICALIRDTINASKHYLNLLCHNPAPLMQSFDPEDSIGDMKR